MRALIFLLCYSTLIGCTKEQSIYFELVDGNDQRINISPDDIKSYSEEYQRGYLQIQSIVLRDNFYSQDTMVLIYPITLNCYLNGKLFYSAEHFLKYKSQTGLGPTFRFDPTCENDWKFNEEYDIDNKKVLLLTDNLCNSIELLYQQNEIEEKLAYYQNQKYFNDYLASGNKLAHEYFLDRKYLSAVKAIND